MVMVIGGEMMRTVPMTNDQSINDHNSCDQEIRLSTFLVVRRSHRATSLLSTDPPAFEVHSALSPHIYMNLLSHHARSIGAPRHRHPLRVFKALRFMRLTAALSAFILPVYHLTHCIPLTCGGSSSEVEVRKRVTDSYVITPSP